MTTTLTDQKAAQGRAKAILDEHEGNVNANRTEQPSRMAASMSGYTGSAAAARMLRGEAKPVSQVNETQSAVRFQEVHAPAPPSAPPSAPSPQPLRIPFAPPSHPSARPARTPCPHAFSSPTEPSPRQGPVRVRVRVRVRVWVRVNLRHVKVESSRNCTAPAPHTAPAAHTAPAPHLHRIFQLLTKGA